ncbi:transcription factor bHLH111 [Mercurialis annua]|uniref:transcription factor bHLH111 n=1 Tax=Mercurialis annua TaxID=3986 RepID=UPI00215DF177|nr:transcription factor bHLH111 [Mercurialis annua]
MAQECSETSVAISSSTPPSGNYWWDLHHHHHHATSLSPWNQPNPSPNSSCEEDVSMSTSFTNASNHSGLTVESSRRFVEPAASSPTDHLIGEHASDSQLWSQILLGVGSNGDLQNNQDVGENFLDALSSKSSIFEPACDYLKKMDGNWEFTNSQSSFNNFDKHINNGFNNNPDQHQHQHHQHQHQHQHRQGLIDGDQRINKLSNLVSNWSIAPPDPITCNISLSSSGLNHYAPQPQTFGDSATSCGAAGIGRSSSGLIFSGYGSHNLLKVENDPEVGAESGYFIRRPSYDSNGLGVGNYDQHSGVNNGNSSIVADNKYYYGAADNIYSSARNFHDGLSFNGRFSKPLIDIQGHKPCSKSMNLSDRRKHGLQNSSQTVKGQGNSSEGKKKRIEDNSETVLKKPKHESSTASSVKMQVPKVKLGDKITALQQIVSPFGKTDTASVLLEAIQYIKFLQEQVQLLSNPYMKSNSHKDPWGGLDKKEKELRSRGLCLVPISCTPQLYHDNTGSDYWTPTYRGCLYR